MKDREDLFCSGKSGLELDEDLEVCLRNKTSRWEVTPRTATQSKRLKWDQTPLGYIKMKDKMWSGKRAYETSGGWDYEEDEKSTMLYSEMSLREINMCLPTRGYRRYDIIQEKDIEGDFEISDMPEIRESEKDFFIPILHQRDYKEVDVYKGLLLVKNGDRKMYERGKKMLIKVKVECDVNVVFEKVILMMTSLELTFEEKYRMLELMKSLLENAEMEEVLYVKEILFIVCSYSFFHSLRKQSTDVLSAIYRLGIEFVVKKIETAFPSKEIHIRDLVSKIIATLAGYFGMREVSGLLRKLCADFRNDVRRTSVRSVVEICNFIGRDIISDVEPVLDILCSLSVDKNRFVRMEAACGISLIVRTIRPFRSEQEYKMFFILKDRALRSQGKEFYCFIEAMSHLCHTKEFSDVVYEILDTSESRGVPDIRVFRQICDKIDKKKSQEYFATIINDTLSLTTGRNRNLAVDVCIKMARDREMAKVLLRHYSECSSVGLLSEVFSKLPELDFEEEDITVYYRGIREALNHDETTVDLVHLLVNKKFLRHELISQIVADSVKFLKCLSSETRIRGLRIIMNMAGMLDAKNLLCCGAILFENMNVEDKSILIHVLRAMCSIYNLHKFKHASVIVPNILPILKSREAEVVEAAMLLLRAICLNSFEECKDVNTREWLRISYELIGVLTSWDKVTRKTSVEVLGHISRIIGPQEILNILMDYLESEDKHQRMGVSLAISVLAEQNGVFTVLPTLLSDYSIPNLFIQQGVLKTMCHILQRVNFIPESCIYSMLPAIEDAIMDENPVYRNFGLKLVKHLTLNHAQPSVNTQLIIHLLNLTWINILDHTPEIRCSFDEAIESFATTLSSQMMYKYIISGLFHPAKVVRKRYYDVFKIMEHFDSTSLSQCFLVEENFLGLL